ADAAALHALDEVRAGRAAGPDADMAQRRFWGRGVGAIHYWLLDLALERQTELAATQQQREKDDDSRMQTRCGSPPLADGGGGGNGGGTLLVADAGLISGISVRRAVADVQGDLPSSGDGGDGGDASIGTLGTVEAGGSSSGGVEGVGSVGFVEGCSGPSAEADPEGHQAPGYATNMVEAEAALGLVSSPQEAAEAAREKMTAEAAADAGGSEHAARWARSYGGSVEAEVSEGLAGSGSATAVRRRGGYPDGSGTDSEMLRGDDASADEAARAATEKVVELLTHPEDFIEELQEEEGPGWVSPDYVMGVVAAAKDPGIGIPQRHQEQHNTPPEDSFLVPELEEGMGKWRGSGPQGDEQPLSSSSSGGTGALDNVREFLRTAPLHGPPGAPHHHPGG
ncbi:hypothetical protein Vafri_5356, partial [Volvox africanus]